MTPHLHAPKNIRNLGTDGENRSREGSKVTEVKEAINQNHISSTPGTLSKPTSSCKL